MAGMSQTASREVCPAGTFSTTEGCPKIMETRTSSEGSVLSAMGLPGHFPGKLNLRRKFVQDSENPKFGKKDWKIPRAGRIIKLSACSAPWKKTGRLCP